jgi:hypothetical protein
MDNRDELHIPFSKYKKWLNKSVSYVIAEKSFDDQEEVDLKELDDIADVFRQKSAQRKWICDANACKWFLVIELKADDDKEFFKSAVPSFATKDVKVYLWSGR